MSTTIEKAIFPDLRKEQCIALTTFRRTGQAVTTPVWLAISLGTIYVETHADAGKLKRLRHTARVTLAPCTYSGKVTGSVSEGNARILTESEESTASCSLSLELLGACFTGRRKLMKSILLSNPFQAESETFNGVQSCGEGGVSDPFSRPTRL